MSGVIARLAWLPALAFAVLMALMHLQPDRSNAVRAIIGPDSTCAAPCFLGIQPHVTTSDQALERLKASGWADAIQRSANAITWRWNGHQSPLIDGSVQGQVVIAVTQTVAYINVQTRIQVSDLWLTYGVPTRGFVAYRRGAMLHIVSYPDRQFDASLVTDCPAPHFGFWATEASIYWGITVASADSDTSYAQAWRRNVTC